MKYRLRFFLDNGKNMTEQTCFATVESRHLPNLHDEVYLGDELIDTVSFPEIETGSVYEVINRVLVYNNYRDGRDNLTSVEISVRAAS